MGIINVCHFPKNAKSYNYVYQTLEFVDQTNTMHKLKFNTCKLFFEPKLQKKKNLQIANDNIYTSVQLLLLDSMALPDRYMSV